MAEMPTRLGATAGLARTLAIAALALCGSLAAVRAEYDKPVHGFAMYDEPALPAGFKNFPYADPSAPKGGTLRMSMVGNYDTFNPYILKGDPADGIVPLDNDRAPQVPGSVFESLASFSSDEPFTMYGWIAETIVVPKDRSYVTFNLRKEARFHDGTPITPEDVIFSFNTLRDKGLPFFRSYYEGVAKVEKTGANGVTFRFVSANQKELPLILGQLPVLSKAYYTKTDFTQSSVVPPLGSGPYKVAKFDLGRSITLERVKDYWGKGLPVNVGRFNFDTIKIDYFRDEIPAFEAFKSGQYDVRVENSAKRWATEYVFPAIKRGDVKREKIPLEATNGVQGLFFNTRREIFKDVRVRKALQNAFDFEWENRVLAYGEYNHSRSFFNNSDLESKGAPQGKELALLETYRGKVPEDVFKAYDPPSTKHRDIRENLRDASVLLTQAGWTNKAGKLVDKNGKPLKFEILIASSPDTERLILPVVQNLKSLGVEASIRAVEFAQFVNRVRDFDYDMLYGSVGQSDSPGNEQRLFWSTKTADEKGSRNYAGVRDPAVDAIIEGLVLADTRADLVAHVHALDRLLQQGHYVIPFWHLAAMRIAYWKNMAHPARWPKHGPAFSTWWAAPGGGTAAPAVKPK